MSTIYSDNIYFIFCMILSSIIYNCFICYYINYKELKQLNLIESILTLQDKTDTSFSVAKIRLRNDLEDYKLELTNFIDDLLVTINDADELKKELLYILIKLDKISDDTTHLGGKYIELEDLVKCIICYIGSSRGIKFTLSNFISNTPRDYLITEKI